MAKYKIGDEVLVKAKITKCNGDGTYKSETNYSILTIGNKDIQKSPDMTAEESWEIAKKLFADYSNAELDDIFEKGWSFPQLMELTPQQAKAKIEAWEAEKEIKVGDVVRVTLGKLDEGETDTALITWVHENNWYDLIMKNGLGWTYVNGERKKAQNPTAQTSATDALGRRIMIARGVWMKNK